MGNTFTKQSHVDYVNTHIGKIISIKPNKGKKLYYVEYGEDDHKFRFIIYDINDIKYWSKNYDELIPLLKAAKYNVL